MILMWAWSLVFHWLLPVGGDVWYSFPLAMTAFITAGVEFVVEIIYVVRWLYKKPQSGS